MTVSRAISAAEKLLSELSTWEKYEDAQTFPYAAVIGCYRSCGKHFVPFSVCVALASARKRVADLGEHLPGQTKLATFLDVALDKWDDRYNYLTYLGIDLLDLQPEADGTTGRAQRDEWVALLLCDLWSFERGALAGTHDWLTEMRPGAALARKRMKLLTDVLVPLLPAAGTHTDCAGLDELTRERVAQTTADQRCRLALSMQPVYLVHDEYMFIRVLQSFEVTFAAMAGHVRDAIGAVREGRAHDAAASLAWCATVLQEARLLFSLLATMQVESFRTFRVYTVGASAIQSGNYKTFEALCSMPLPERAESLAYEAVPQVRHRLDSGWQDLTSTVGQAVARGVIDADGLRLLCAAALELEDVHQRWKQTHWKLAVRMIGEEVGTGYTVGAPYLQSVLDNRLFARLAGVGARA
ncbi:MAG TPA: hypothetical protein VGS19_35320 [Streptosporangiaceae bacterium]|nr:hypothetical protein [Streptosporangiaceae bacterium]